ncbi:MAG: tRNA (adenosine(37)-N6)-threonylcarbamoyltransferase complex ATPase subunit type 1 TsaE [Rhodospirillales bacterium]|nr:tRNA (adenosine(37)-N6)-threonylcarbamoyltransferase complex ATPase subunit type 1 TsaE [Rhodospirillales bacterium]MDE0712836.1 tRNA (adenosine(37)-N6)-threonylcarbamoyltransferase complex ATPase subunit type 1 TsaE [Rhodospirillales bacterium]
MEPAPASGATGPRRRLLLPDTDATRDLAANLAQLARRGDVIGLVGPLGAGKTTFARSFIGALGGTDLVPSPTWSLVEQHSTGAGDVWHFDLHRLERADDVWELGLEDALADGITLIEWPEIVERLLPPARLTLRLDHAGTGRTVTLEPGATWGSRLQKVADNG